MLHSRHRPRPTRLPGSWTVPPERTVPCLSPTAKAPPRSAGGNPNPAPSSTSTFIWVLDSTAGPPWITTIGGLVAAGTGITTPPPVILLAGAFCAGVARGATPWDGDPGGTAPTVWNGGRPLGIGASPACTTSRCHLRRRHLPNSAGKHWSMEILAWPGVIFSSGSQWTPLTPTVGWGSRCARGCEEMPPACKQNC